MIERREKRIGKTTYKVEQFGAKQGRLVLFRLFRLLGPAMSALAEGGDPGDMIGRALRRFAESANESDFDSLCEAFAAKTKVVHEATTAGGTVGVDLDLAADFDSHFANNYGEMLQWLAFAIEANYASFLGENGAALEKLGASLGKTKSA